MARFDFSGYIHQRDEAILRQEKAERDKQEQSRQTWVDLRREAGNYVHRNGNLCQVTGEYPGIILTAGDGESLIITVKDRATFILTYPGKRNFGALETSDKTSQANGDQVLMSAVVGWYEAKFKRSA